MFRKEMTVTNFLSYGEHERQIGLIQMELLV